MLSSMHIQTLLYYLAPKNLALNYLGAYQRQPTTRWSPTLRAKGGIVESHVDVEE